MRDTRFLAAAAFFLVALYFDVMGTAIGTEGFTGGTEGDALLRAMQDQFGRWMVVMPILYFVMIVYLSCVLRYAWRRGHIRFAGLNFISMLVLTTAGVGNLLGGMSRLLPAWEPVHQALYYDNVIADADPTWFLYRYALLISLGAVLAYVFLHVRMPVLRPNNRSTITSTS